MSKMEKRKPNGLEIGVFVISIDDGYVEYSYHVKPEEPYGSISEIHKWICRVLGAKREEGKIRPDGCKRLRALCWRESQALKEALKRKDNKSMIAVVADSLEAEGLEKGR